MIPLPVEYGHEILRTEVGSTLHGTGLGVALEDHDEMSIYLERPDSTLGLHDAEHYVTRTAPGNERSKPGDTDLVCYSARKYVRLALKGNPSVLLPLFAPDDKVIVITEHGRHLRENAAWFASRRAGNAFLGYMQRQRMRMVGERGTAGRVRVMPDGGIDWKYAMHMLRLGHQGVEFLDTGRITLPIPGDTGEHLREVRQGHVSFDDVVEEAVGLETRLIALRDESGLPEQPDRDAAHKWLIDAHITAWGLAPVN